MIKFKVGDKVYCISTKEIGIIENIIDNIAYVNFKIENKHKKVYQEQKRYIAEPIMLRDLKTIKNNIKNGKKL